MTTLAEMRQANMKEQNAPGQEPVPQTPAAEPAASLPASNAPAAAAPPAAPVPEPAASPLRLSVVPAAPTEEMLRDAAYLARVREAMSRKVIHPTGAKATVDMEPALFHRAKRYCNEHGNISLRQVFLELLTVYLEEEGY